MPHSKDVSQVDVLCGRDATEVLERKEAGQLESNVALRAYFSLGQDGGKLFLVKLFGARWIMLLHSFELVAGHRGDVLLPMIMDVLLQRVEGLAGGEQVTN